MWRKVSTTLLGLFVIFFAITAKNAKSAEEQLHPPYLRLALSGLVDSVDPFDGHPEIVKLLFAGLTEIDPETLQPAPSLATHWDVSDNGNMYTFFLRQDARWSNGDPLTADDVVRTLRRYLDPFGEPANYLFILKNAQEFYDGDIEDDSLLGVRALDTHTLQFTLESPTPLFPVITSFLHFRPVPVELIEQYEEEGADWRDPQRLVGSGPYTLTRWRKEKFLFLTKNPAYFDAASVQIPEIRYAMIPSSEIALKIYEADELDLTPLFKKEQLSRIQGNSALDEQLSQKPRLETWYLGFNHAQPPADQLLVRKAIAAAIDKKFLLDKILRLIGQHAATFTSPPAFGFVEPEAQIGIEFDPEQARRWLAEAGYPDGQALPELIIMVKDRAASKVVLKPLAFMLERHLNIRVVIQSEEDVGFMEEYHLFLDFRKAEYPDAHNFLADTFHPDNTDNVLFWDNQEYAELLDRAFRLHDPGQRKSLYHRAEQILCEEDAAIVPLFFREIAFLAKPWLQWTYSPTGGQQIWKWSFMD